jgi:hypothetical protein
MLWNLIDQYHCDSLTFPLDAKLLLVQTSNTDMFSWINSCYLINLDLWIYTVRQIDRSTF